MSPRDIPTMRVNAAWSSRSGCWTLAGTCPLCQRHHFHGGGAGPRPSLGSRVAHCGMAPAASYLLVLAARPTGHPRAGSDPHDGRTVPPAVFSHREEPPS